MSEFVFPEDVIAVGRTLYAPDGAQRKVTDHTTVRRADYLLSDYGGLHAISSQEGTPTEVKVMWDYTRDNINP